MLEITPQQRRELRARAHHLDPVVSIGHNGLTPKVLHEIDVALRAHQLVKVRVFDDDRKSREAMLARIASELSAAPVQHLGKLLILWRPAEEETKHEAPRKATRKRRAATPASPSRGPREAFAPGPRRQRGSEQSRATPPASHAMRRRRRAGDGEGKPEDRWSPRAARGAVSFDPARKRRGDGTASAAGARRRRVFGSTTPSATGPRRRTAVAERAAPTGQSRRRRRSS